MSRPNIDDMRKYILDKYPGMSWHERVYKMEPRQVAAIYKNIKKREALLKKFNLDKALPIFTPKIKDCHQIDMFEYLLSLKGE